MTLEANKIELMAAGFDGYRTVPTHSALTQLEKRQEFPHGAEAYQSRYWVVETISDGLFPFVPIQNPLGEFDLVAAMHSVRAMLEGRNAKAIGEFQFQIVVAEDDETRYWVKVADRYIQSY